ncbi:MAG TPA: bacteriohemerythrin [Syntrophales bacterium]|nr:bacteriohemerythrin [Syntrophales bacterium]HOM07760.1 bacteriohemerythrin [Syntrophales bacterium]HPQ06008.1 bacteriohemerythrin [Syntrophales bacterium]HRS86625.1 bacteriohemerythrin [Syntrophales bacterium]
MTSDTGGKIERLTWNPRFSVGFENLDEQHRHLFAILNRLVDLHETASADPLPVLEELVAYSGEHFHAENLVMMKARFPGYGEHAQEHDRFVDRLRSFLSSYRQNREGLTRDMLAYVREWLLTHTQVTDMFYADFIRRSGHSSNT